MLHLHSPKPSKCKQPDKAQGDGGGLASVVNLPSNQREQAMNDKAKKADFDFDDLLHPAQAFLHPSEVVHDPDLTLNEKRAILASWLRMPVRSRQRRT